MLVGEVPATARTARGSPFVGPAGRELDRALEAVGIERGDVYLTNAVKHFKFEERGKRRIHQTPKKGEVDACLPWLDTEIKLVKPRGARHARRDRGEGAARLELPPHPAPRRAARLRRRATIVAATIHPSAILRNRDEEARRAEREAFADDLRVVVRALG